MVVASPKSTSCLQTYVRHSPASECPRLHASCSRLLLLVIGLSDVGNTGQLYETWERAVKVSRGCEAAQPSSPQNTTASQVNATSEGSQDSGSHISASPQKAAVTKSPCAPLHPLCSMQCPTRVQTTIWQSGCRPTNHGWCIKTMTC